jgi:hypothetical protein
LIARQGEEPDEDALSRGRQMIQMAVQPDEELHAMIESVGWQTIHQDFHA